MTPTASGSRAPWTVPGQVRALTATWNTPAADFFSALGFRSVAAERALDLA